MTTLLKTSEIGSLYWRFLLLFPAWQRQRPTRRRNRLLLYTGGVRVRPAPSPAHDGMQRGPGLGVGPTVRQAIIRVGSSPNIWVLEIFYATWYCDSRPYM